MAECAISRRGGRSGLHAGGRGPVPWSTWAITDMLRMFSFLRSRTTNRAPSASDIPRAYGAGTNGLCRAAHGAPSYTHTQETGAAVRSGRSHASPARSPDTPADAADLKSPDAAAQSPVWQRLRRYSERRNPRVPYARAAGPRKPSGATASADSGMAAGHHHPRHREQWRGGGAERPGRTCP